MLQVRTARFALLTACMLLAPAVAHAADTNPAYLAWAKFGVGTTATYDMNMDLPNGQRNLTYTSKLDALDADKATIETTIQMFGSTHTSKRDIQANNQHTMPDPTGEEDITIDGKSYHCKVYSLDQSQLKAMGGGAGGGQGIPPGVQETVKVWMCPDVPGALARVDSRATINQMNFHTEVTMKSFGAK